MPRYRRSGKLRHSKNPRKPLSYVDKEAIYNKFKGLPEGLIRLLIRNQRAKQYYIYKHVSTFGNGFQKAQNKIKQYIEQHNISEEFIPGVLLPGYFYHGYPSHKNLWGFCIPCPHCNCMVETPESIKLNSIRHFDDRYDDYFNISL